VELINSPAPLSSRLTLDTFALIRELAPKWHTCRWFGISDPDQAIVIMAKAADLGLPITSAFDLIKPIQGSGGTDLALIPRGAQALILASGLLEDMQIDQAPGRCTVTLKRRGVPSPITITYTIDDARRAGLTEGTPLGNGRTRGPGGYEKWLANMLRWRALGFAQDLLFADVCGGLSSAAKFNIEIDEQGSIPQTIARAATGMPECDHMMAVAGDVICPGCGFPLGAVDGGTK